jgi:hypothetical protein
MERDQTGCDALFTVGSDPPDMMGIPERHDNEAGFAAPFDGGIHRLKSNALSITSLTIENHDRPVIPDQICACVGKQEPILHASDIGGEHDGPMAVMPGQIGANQVFCDNSSFILVTAGLLQNLLQQTFQSLFGYYFQDISALFEIGVIFQFPFTVFDFKYTHAELVNPSLMLVK